MQPHARLYPAGVVQARLEEGVHTTFNRAIKSDPFNRWTRMPAKQPQVRVRGTIAQR